MLLLDLAAASGRVSKTGACAAQLLHLDVSTLQMPLLHPAVSTPQGPEQHLDLYEHKEPMVTLDVSTP